MCFDLRYRVLGLSEIPRVGEIALERLGGRPHGELRIDCVIRAGVLPSRVEPDLPDVGVGHLRFGRARQRLDLGDGDSAADAQLPRHGEVDERRDRRAIVVRAGDAWIRDQRRECRITPILIEGRPLEARAQAFGAQLAALHPHAEAGILLDQFITMVDRDDWGDAEVAAADGEVHEGAPPLIRVIEQIGFHRREAQPSRRFPLVEDEQQADFAGAAAADHPPAHVVVRKRRSHLRFDLVDVLGSEGLADQRLHLGVQIGGDIALADSADLHALDQIAGIGVTASILIAHVRHDEHDADLARRHADDAHRGDVSRLLLFDPGRQFVEARAIEWSAGEPRDVFLEARTEATEVEPGYLRRGDDGAVGGIGRLRPCRQRHCEQSEHESGFGHARCGVQALRHYLTC